MGKKLSLPIGHLYLGIYILTTSSIKIVYFSYSFVCYCPIESKDKTAKIANSLAIKPDSHFRVLIIAQRVYARRIPIYRNLICLSH